MMSQLTVGRPRQQFFLFSHNGLLCQEEHGAEVEEIIRLSEKNSEKSNCTTYRAGIIIGMHAQRGPENDLRL
jgi:hypothetical protein